MASETLEERVSRLESEVARLKAEGTRPAWERQGVIGRTSPDFLDRFFGIFADSTNFEELQRGIEQEREEVRRAAEEEET